MGAVSPKLRHPHHHGQDRHGAVGDTGPLGHGGEPVPDVFDRDGVYGHVAEGGQNVLAHNAGVGCLGPGLPAAGLSVKELLGEGGHRMSRRPGAVVLFRRLDVLGDQPAGLAPGLAGRHGVGIADGGVAPAPAHHALLGEGARAARKDPEDQARHHVVAEFVAPVAGLGGADAPGEGGFFVHGRGSLFEPRGWVVVQEAAAAAFRRGSRASERNRALRKSLTLQAFPPVHAMAGAGGKCTNGGWGVKTNRRRASKPRFVPAQVLEWCKPLFVRHVA